MQFVNEGITCQYYTLNDKLNRKIENITELSNNIYCDSFSYHDAGDNTTNFVETLTFSTSTNEANSSVDKGTITYLYNNMGHISSISYDSVTNTYDYDSHGRIVKEVNNQFGKKFIYSYDSKGNLSSKKTYLLANNTLPETKDYDDPYELDNFYPTTINGKSVSFEFGKLVSYGNIAFEYDILGNRRSKGTAENNTTTYLYEDGKLIIQRNPNGTELEFIYGDSSIIGFKHKTSNETKLYYFRKNILGDVIELYYNGSVVAKYAYDAWGNHVVYDANGDTNTSTTFIGNINPIRYRGYYYDVETQLYWVSSRYYSPELGRFIQPADVSTFNPLNINGLNLYSYANNNPIGVAYRSSGAGGGMVSSIASSVGGLNSGYHGAISNSSKWHFDPNFLTEAFGHIENGFSIIEGALTGYLNVKHLPQLESLSKISKKLMIGGIVLGLVVDAHNNFSNEQLSLKEQIIGFAVDGLYTVGSAALSYGISALVTAGLALIPGVGLFAVLGGALVSIGVMELIDWAVEEYGWLDSIKDWIESW